MKKLWIAIVLMGIFFSLSSCSHEHKWQEATCVSPKTCSKCGLTEGSIVANHDFVSDKCKDCGVFRLTLDNYKDYLVYDVYYKAGKTGPVFNFQNSIRYYETIKCFVDWTGNSHYKFENVSVKVRFYHLIKNNETGDYEEYDQETITVELSMAGKGSGSSELDVFPSNKEEGVIVADFHNVSSRTRMEIIDIFGTVEEY